VEAEDMRNRDIQRNTETDCGCKKHQAAVSTHFRRVFGTKTWHFLHHGRRARNMGRIFDQSQSPTYKSNATRLTSGKHGTLFTVSPLKTGRGTTELQVGRRSLSELHQRELTSVLPPSSADDQRRRRYSTLLHVVLSHAWRTHEIIGQPAN
jgi:hypothetical protein